MHLSLERKTMFWRYQDIGENALSTIEAIHSLYKEIEENSGADGGGGGAEVENVNLDGLLKFFLHQYSLIQKWYKERPDKEYTQKHRDNYIKK